MALVAPVGASYLIQLSRFMPSGYGDTVLSRLWRALPRVFGQSALIDTPIVPRPGYGVNPHGTYWPSDWRLDNLH